MVTLDKAPYQTAIELFESDNYDYIIMALKIMVNDLETFRDFLKSTFRNSHVYVTTLKSGNILYILDYMVETNDNKLYTWLTKNVPEGKNRAGGKEQEDFEKWLGV